MDTSAIERTTGREWSEWVALLDRHGAREYDHGAIATVAAGHMATQVDNPAWWAQSVAVAYEQHIGRRVPGQRADGTFQMSVTRSTPLDMHALMERWRAFSEADAEVASLITGDVRPSGPEKRLHWRAKATDGSTIQVTAEPRATGAALIATATGTPHLEANEAARAAWAAVVERCVGSL